MRKVHGFQMIEALLVLFIVQILGVISYTTVTSHTAKTMCDATISNVQEYLMMYQMMSQVKKYEVDIVINERDITYIMNHDMKLQNLDVEIKSNFIDNKIRITREGTWTRGGTIYFDACSQKITIGIGQSMAKRSYI